jgi:hypothetical protein
MGTTEDMKNGRKCFYEPCKCQVPLTERFCSDYCKDASEVEEIEIQCGCEHPACDLD